MKSLINLSLCIICVFLVTNCSLIFTSKKKVTFKCGVNEIITLKPPSGVYKCQINILSYCSPLDSIQILINGKIYHSLKFSTDEIGEMMNNDWYESELGLQYIPTQSESLSQHDKGVKLEVLFHTNRG